MFSCCGPRAPLVLPGWGVMCNGLAGAGSSNAVWRLSVSVPCQPATKQPCPTKRKRRSSYSLQNIPSGAPTVASFSESPLLTPSGQETVAKPRSQRPPGAPTLRRPRQLLAPPRDTRVESVQVCIFNLTAPSLLFAPRLKSPLIPALFGTS